MIKVGMVSLGCSKNLVDAERMMHNLVANGMTLENDPRNCNAVIINTCGFIEAAKEESIESILEFAALKGNGILKVVAVTGCLAERYKEDIAREIPEVDVVLGIGSNADIVAAIKLALTGEKTQQFGDKLALSLEGDRLLTTPSHYAYIKVAEGCDNHCSYCAIPLIRGGFRSRKIESIVKEAGELAARGVKEINLIAQDTTRYGQDIYGKLALTDLLRELVKIEDIKWIRLLYCYPERITSELIEFINSEDKVVNYLDIPLQHISDNMLKAMNRRNTKQEAVELIGKIRSSIKDVVIRTTFITGFPGETEDDFSQLCDFVESTKFQRLGCFAYSREEDTPAYNMKDQIDPEVKQRRAEIIMEMQMEISRRFMISLIGKELEVLVEGYDDAEKLWYGRSYMDAPEVDGNVFFDGKSFTIGDFIKVEITGGNDYDLFGKVVV